jgi:hypothetical protein
MMRTKVSWKRSSARYLSFTINKNRAKEFFLVAANECLKGFAVSFLEGYHKLCIGEIVKLSHTNVFREHEHATQRVGLFFTFP